MNALTALRTASLLVANAARVAGPAPADASGARVHALATRGIQPPRVDPAGVGSLFSVNHTDANQLRVELMERVGREFGFELSDFDNSAEMSAAIREAMRPLSPAAVAAIEKDLGLDELGVSLVDVVEAMREPGGSADRKLTEALREKAGLRTPDEERRVSFDEIGRYHPAH